MTQKPIERLAHTFRLTDFVDVEQAENTVNFLTRLFAWRFKHDINPDIPRDDLLALLNEDPIIRLNFLLYLSLYDPAFFYLAKRMAANTLVKQKPPARPYLLIAAQLLQMEAPKQVSPKSTLRGLITMAVAVSGLMNLKPTGVHGACARLSVSLESEFGVSVTYHSIVDAWKSETDNLSNLGFSDQSVLEFFRVTSPMQDNSK